MAITTAKRGAIQRDWLRYAYVAFLIGGHLGRPGYPRDYTARQARAWTLFGRPFVRGSER